MYTEKYMYIHIYLYVYIHIHTHFLPVYVCIYEMDIHQSINPVCVYTKWTYTNQSIPCVYIWNGHTPYGQSIAPNRQILHPPPKKKVVHIRFQTELANFLQVKRQTTQKQMYDTSYVQHQHHALLDRCPTLPRAHPAAAPAEQNRPETSFARSGGFCVRENTSAQQRGPK